jgi:pSer/pThr/pTyr-binding forkhead associated (FHA) protein
MNAPAPHEHAPLDRQHDTDPPSTLRTSSQSENGDSTVHVMAIWEGGHASCVVPLEGRIVIGRAPTADLRIASNSVSREHAVIIAGNRR